MHRASHKTWSDRKAEVIIDFSFFTASCAANSIYPGGDSDRLNMMVRVTDVDGDIIVVG